MVERIARRMRNGRKFLDTRDKLFGLAVSHALARKATHDAEQGFPEFEDLDSRLLVNHRDAGTSPGHDLNESYIGDLTECFAYGRVRNLKPFGNFPFPDPGTRRDPPFNDVLNQRCRDDPVLRQSISYNFLRQFFWLVWHTDHLHFSRFHLALIVFKRQYYR